MHLLRPLPVIAATCLAAASTALAQFSPGPNPLTGTNTAAETLSSGTGTINSGATLTVSGSTTAVTMSGGSAGSPTTLNNSGSINQTGTGRAIRAITTGSNLLIQNFGGGSISALGNDTITVGSSTITASTVSLINAGTITSGNTSTTAGNQAVNFGNLTSGTNSVSNSGTITAYVADAVRPGVNGTVLNSGTIFSTQNVSTGSGSDGIDTQTNSGVQITNGPVNTGDAARIEGGRHGITGGSPTANITMTITNQAGGTIQGDNGSGVNIDGNGASEVVTINNSGTITGNGARLTSSGGVQATSQDGDGVDVDGLVNLTNSGAIRSINAIADTSEGVTVGGGTIVNNAGALIEGDIANGNTSGATGKGITILGVDKDANGNPLTSIAAMYANTTITNSGTIRGQTTSGITIGYDNATGVTVTASGFTSTINNNAGGLIEGAGATAAAIQTGPDNDTINNSGQIVADSSNLAIDLGGGNNTLNITGGSASIIGNVSGGTGGTNALTITPGAGNAFTYAGTLSNFASAQIGVSQTGADGTTTFSGGRVTLSGANTYTGPTTVYSGATLVANTPVASGSATGSGGVSILSGGVLAGVGNVAGTVTLASGANLSPGDNGAGTLTLGTNLNTTGGSTFTYDIGGDQLHSDRLTLMGTLSFSGSGRMTFNIVSNSIATGTFDLIDFAGSSGLTTANLGFGMVPAGFAGTFTLTGTELALNVTAVPEPGTVAWWGIALAIVALVTVRQKKAA